MISHFAYSYGFYGTFFSFTQSSVIATLTLCLLSVNIVNTKKLSIAYKLPLIAIAAFFADKCDWGMTAIVFTLSFEFARGDKKAMYRILYCCNLVLSAGYRVSYKRSI